VKRWSLFVICVVCLAGYLSGNILHSPAVLADNSIFSSFDPQAVGQARLQMSTPASSPATTAKRPKTGAIIKDTGTIRGGWGNLTIENSLQYDIVVFLTHHESKKTLYAVYIRTNYRLTVFEVPEGVYDLYFVEGENWDRKEKTFQRVIARKRLRNPLEFWTKPYRLGKRIKYNYISVPLHPATLHLFTEEVGEQDFPGLK